VNDEPELDSEPEVLNVDDQPASTDKDKDKTEDEAGNDSDV